MTTSKQLISIANCEIGKLSKELLKKHCLNDIEGLWHDKLEYHFENDKAKIKISLKLSVETELK